MGLKDVPVQSLFMCPTSLHMKHLPLNSCLTSLGGSSCLGLSTCSVFLGSSCFSDKSINSTSFDTSVDVLDSTLLRSDSLRDSIIGSSSLLISTFLADFSLKDI